MEVRSFEIVEADLRLLHDHLIEVGGFQFRAGGAGFFVLVGEKFHARTGAHQSQMIVAQIEADTVSIDVVASAGKSMAGIDFGTERAFLSRATELLNGFAARHGLELADL